MALTILNSGSRSGLCGVGTCFYERVKGWPGAGFEWQDTEITVDRLDHEGSDQLRLNICIRTNTGKRTREELGSITLHNDAAEAFIAATMAKRAAKAA